MVEVIGKETDSSPNYYLRVKLFSEQNINQSFRAHDLYEVNETKRLFKPFRPRSLHFNPKQKFGVIRGDRLCFLNILKMDETVKGLEVGRTIAHKRKSIGDESIPLKKFKLAAETDVIHDEKETQSQRNDHVHKNDSKMREQLDNGTKNGSSGSSSGNKHKKKKKRSKSKSKDEPSKDGNSDQELFDFENYGKGKSSDWTNVLMDDMNTKPHDMLKDNKNKHLSSENDINDLNKDDTGNVNGEISNNIVSGGVVESKKEGESDSGTTGGLHQDSMKSVNGVITNISETAKSSTESTQQRDACQKCPQLEQEISELKKQLQSAQVTGNNVISELKEQISKMPELVRVFSIEKQFLKDEKYIVMPEKEHKKIRVGDDEVYCGSGIVVKKFDLYDVTEQTTLGRRVSRLCDLFWKNEAHCHFLSGKCGRAPPDMTIYKISDNEITSMKRILRKMSWEGIAKDDLNDSGIREHVKHYTSESLGRFLGQKRKPAQPKAQLKPKKKGTASSSEEEDTSSKAKKKKRNRKLSSSGASSDSDKEKGMKKVSEAKKTSNKDSSDSEGDSTPSQVSD